MRRNCNLQPTKEFTHTDCAGNVKTLFGWGGRVNTTEVEEHPYALSTTTFRTNADSANFQFGDSLVYDGNTYTIRSVQTSISLCRAVIKACRPVFICPMVSAVLEHEVKYYGCDAQEKQFYDKTFDVVLRLAQASEQFAESSVDWVERYRIYFDQSNSGLINFQSWFLIENNHYRVENLIDMDRVCRLPYAEAVKDCPSWDVE